MSKKQQIIHKSWFTDKQVEMILDKLSLLLDALPVVMIMSMPAIVAIAYIIWGEGK